MLKAPTILLTDDEKSFRVSTAELLRSEGHICDEASNAYEAMEQLGRRHYDLLIADIRMPGNRNLEFIKNLPEQAPGLPVILVTGYPSTETAITSIYLPVVGYLQKPFSYKSLLSQVETAVSRSKDSRIIEEVQSLLKRCVDDLAQVQHRRKTRDDQATNADSAAIAAVLKLLAGAMSELATLHQPVEDSHDAPSVCELANCPSWRTHRDKIRKAIALLNETKRRFKSKELAKVRELLESLLK